MFLNRKKLSQPANVTTKRDFSDRNIEVFKQKLVLTDFDDILDIDDAELAFNQGLQIFLGTLLHFFWKNYSIYSSLLPNYSTITPPS